MKHLHSCGIVHGSLTIRHCVVDKKWNVRIADWLDSSIYVKLGEWHKEFYPKIKNIESIYLTLAPELIFIQDKQKVVNLLRLSLNAT